MQRMNHRHLFAAALASSLLLASCGRSSGKADAMVRQDFKAAVIGKSPEEVIAVVGRPDDTTQLPGLDTWTYRNRTIDPVTGKTGTAILMIRGGSVADVVF